MQRPVLFGHLSDSKASLTVLEVHLFIYIYMLYLNTCYDFLEALPTDLRQLDTTRTHTRCMYTSYWDAPKSWKNVLTLLKRFPTNLKID